LRKNGRKSFLSVIIPFYNEEKNLEQGKIEEVHHYLEKQDYRWEVILVNDGSTDNSRNLISDFVRNRPHCTVMDIPHGGKPAAVWAGIRRSKGEIVFFIDLDQSTPIHEIGSILPWFDRGYDMVIGSRGTKREGLTIVRRFGSHVFRTLRRLVILGRIIDTQCGFKSCRRETALEIFPQLHYFKQKKKPAGWKVSAYDVELLFLFQKKGYRIKEVVVQWQDRDLSNTKRQKGRLIRYIRESLQMAGEVMRVKLNQIKGVYD
jgi:dolichyl-phosphate beta-glucosyltransferase